MRETLPANVSESTRPALPKHWVEKIFSLMAAMYGARFSDMWRSANLEEVKTVWASKLAGFAERPSCIKLALDDLDGKPFPPTLPEFLELCRNAARYESEERARLPERSTPEELERAIAAAQQVRKALDKSSLDPLEWARHPRSQVAANYLIATAKTDSRLADILAQNVARGILSEAGKLLTAA